jgi:peptide/nickel transport system ATP-binding protein
MGELSALCEESGSALLLITHDLAMAGRWCQQIAVLDRGQLVEQAPAWQLLSQPQSALAQRLVAAARSREGSPTPAAPAATPVLLELEALRCWHPLPSLPWQQRWYKAVDGVSLRLHEGETIGVVGASGCGKSTLCRALMGLVPVRGGSVRLRGQELNRRARRCIQMVFQDPLACLNPAMTVGQAIADPLLIHRLASRAEARERARELLAAVGLNPPEAFEHRLPRQLSGGQQQRVAIARALANSPKLILADEPTGNLDTQTSEDILALFEELNRQGLTIVLVTHEADVARHANRIMSIVDGRIAGILKNVHHDAG